MSSLRTLVCGGSALPEAVMRAYADEFGIVMTHAWGMTELSPLGSVAREPAGVTGEAVWPYRASQGRLICGVEGRLTGDDGEVLPSDGKAVGELECRGPWITASYYQDDAPEKFHDGWLRTGDVGTLDAAGLHQAHRPGQGRDQVGRRVDLVHGAGELPDGAPGRGRGGGDRRARRASGASARWPPSCSAPTRAPVTPSELRAFLGERVPRWQLPERWAFIDEVPKTSVGKFDKTRIRDAYARGDYKVIEVR